MSDHLVQRLLPCASAYPVDELLGEACPESGKGRGRSMDGRQAREGKPLELAIEDDQGIDR